MSVLLELAVEDLRSCRPLGSPVLDIISVYRLHVLFKIELIDFRMSKLVLTILLSYTTACDVFQFVVGQWECSRLLISMICAV